ncbi:MAG: ATP-binding protein [Bacteroidia bacterium]
MAGRLIFLDSILFVGNYDYLSLGSEYNFDTKNWKLSNYDRLDPFQNIPYTYLKTTVPERLLVGTSKGLCYINIAKKELEVYDKYNQYSLLKEAVINFFHQNEQGVWIATNHGIFLMNEEEEIVAHYDVESGDLPFHDILDIYEDQEGIFWLATRGGGIIQWIPSLDENVPSKSVQLTTMQGLSHNTTYAVYEDIYDRLWIPSDKGIMLMDKNSLDVVTFMPEDGLPHYEFNHTSHYQAKDGMLYFGGLGGIISFHPNQFPPYTENYTPLQLISYAVLESEAKQMTDKTVSLIASQEIFIQPDDKFFEIKFNLLDYEDPDRHNYAYRIKGYNDSWQYIRENVIRITTLPYGNYTLEIKGHNDKRGWSTETLSFRIHVLRPFYLQLWFLAIVLIAMITLVITGVKWRVAKLEAARKNLEQEVEKRTEQIEKDKAFIASQAEQLKQLDKAKTRFFSNITHEFRTPLTLILGPIEQLMTNQPPPNILHRRMKGIHKNALHLQGLINQLLDLSKIESGNMKIELVKGDIIEYTRELCSRFYPMADEKAQNLSFISPLKNWETHFDQGKWDKIIYNLLSNAVKFTPRGGHIQVALGQEQSSELSKGVLLRVSDTGIGISQAELAKIFGRFYQTNDSATRLQGGTGIGLALVKELVELQGGNIDVSSKLNHGTTFDIYLPVGKQIKHFRYQKHQLLHRLFLQKKLKLYLFNTLSGLNQN